MRRASDILATLAFASIFGLLAWLFSLHGTRGLIHIEYLFGVGLIVLAAVGLVPVVLVVRRLSAGRSSSDSRFSAPITVLSLICIAISLFGFAFVGGFPPTPTGDTTPRLIMMAGTGSNGIPDVAVVTESASAQLYSLTWGAANGDSVIRETRNSKQHVFVLGNLEPATQYHYRLNDGPEYAFRTPDTASQALRFAVGSDAHFDTPGSRNDLTRRMLAQIADPANGFDYFFSLGDNVEFGFRPEEWIKAEAALTKASSVLPSTYVAGNHDTLFTGLGRYLGFASPSGVEAQNGTRLWHRTDVGNVHFLILDVEWSAETFTKAQAAWLESELRSIPGDDWTIVMSHGFYYGSGSTTRGWKWYDNKETIKQVTPLFEKYGVDLVFSGHAHQMELLRKSGVTYVIAGAFGGPPDPPREYTSPESLWYSAGNYGYVDLTVEDSAATIVFRDFNGAVLERAVVTKRTTSTAP